MRVKYLLLPVTAGVIVSMLLATASVSFGYKLTAAPDHRLLVKISKSGLNRISNSPYQIVQVTGDDSTYRLKSDEDGQNIYLMPLKDIDEKIEISIKNNIGGVQDLELLVSNIKGQSIDIDSKTQPLLSHQYQQKELKAMLAAMEADISGKYYAQKIKQQRVAGQQVAEQNLGKLDDLEVRQTRLYKWKDFVGGVFVIKNKTRYRQKIDQAGFIKRFDHVLASFVSSKSLAPNQSARFLVIQKLNN